MYISRHDEAMRKVLKAIASGPHGSFLKVADIGRDELAKDLGIVSKRISAQLLTDADIESSGLSANRRRILQLDILLVEASHDGQVTYASAAQILENLSALNFTTLCPKHYGREPPTNTCIQASQPHAAETSHHSAARRRIHI